MIQLIDREEVFLKSWLVDHYISELQNPTGYIDKKSIEEHLYDHLQPFHVYKEVLDDFAILAYAGKNKIGYLTHRSAAFIRFFELIDIKHLYLLDELRCDWLQFPFSYREKREAFKSIVNQAAYHEAFELDIEDLSTILPLFHYSGRHSAPIIWLFSANPQVPLAMFLCDDANFHTSFLVKDREKVTPATSAAGLLMGGLEVCRM